MKPKNSNDVVQSERCGSVDPNREARTKLFYIRSSDRSLFHAENRGWMAMVWRRNRGGRGKCCGVEFKQSIDNVLRSLDMV